MVINTIPTVHLNTLLFHKGEDRKQPYKKQKAELDDIIKCWTLHWTLGDALQISVHDKSFLHRTPDVERIVALSQTYLPIVLYFSL